MSSSEPVLKQLDIILPKPHLGDNRSHENRLRTELEELLNEKVSVPLWVARKLKDLPQYNYQVKTLVIKDQHGWQLVDIFPKDANKTPLGLAIDLGSTSVVFYLVDFLKKQVIKTVSEPNPQIAHGEDILDRILFAAKGEGLNILQKEVVDLFNNVIDRLVKEQGGLREDIFYISVAGNTTMCHFLMALDPSHLCKEPYIPVENSFDLIRASEIGIKAHPLSYLYCFPNVGSYFGGDLLAGILSSKMHKSEELSMLVDVGTNAEVILGNNEWLVACAGAAGPALEGGILECGMRAQPGAIERVEIDPKTLEVKYKTIADAPPRGLCGSGIIDLICAMFLSGIVEPTGKLVPDRDPKRMIQVKGDWAYIVAFEHETAHKRPVYITQSDIKNLIRSKGAMYTILNVVIQSVGIEFKDIDKFYVAGAFGSYIDPEKAITIGMLPDIPRNRFVGLGNAAGKGAVEFLLNKDAMVEVEKIKQNITYLEMNVRGDFMNQLTGALFLPHTDISRFPSVKEKLARLDQN